MEPIAQLQRDEPDAAIVARVVGGQREEFSLLVRRHNQRLFRAARAIVKTDVDAEDVLQQTWLDVFRHLAQFRGDSSFATWATRIAINAALAAVRKQPVIAEVVDGPGGAIPDEEIERAEVGMLLEQCLQDIPQGNREVMVLRDVLELDTAETAACLGLSEEAVRVRLHRGRAAVAATITEKLAEHARSIYSFDGARCDRVTRNVMAQIALLGE